MTNDREEIYFCWVYEGADTFEIYQRAKEQQATRFGQRYTWSESSLGKPVDISYASIRQLDDMTVTLHSIAALPPSPPVISLKFWDALWSFDNQSLWRYFRCDSDGERIHRGLMLGTLAIVHDGSYMPKVD